MITDKDAKKIVLRLRSLSVKHMATDSDAYAQGQHDGRCDAYAQAARMVEGSNYEEADDVSDSGD